MGIIIDTTTQVLTTKQKQDKLATKLRNKSTQAYNQLLAVVTEGFKDVWQNSDGLTVQEGFDSVGKDAVQLCILHVAAVTFINTVKPGLLPTETPKPLTANEDGTITVGE